MDNKVIKGYKVFNPDWTCRSFQYEVGKTFRHDGNIEMCGAGFHFCRKANDCFNYYSFDSKNKVAEVEAIGLVETRDDKSVTDEIKIIREIEWKELLEIVNEGANCTGRCNTGDYNTGNFNTGARNTGNFNTGDFNTGDFNTGNRNTGNFNTGNWNTGNWNKTNFSSGFFNTNESQLIVFNKSLNIDRQSFLESKGIAVLSWNYEDNWWIYSCSMTEEEKKEHPEHITTGGYLKTVDFVTACKMMWDNLDEEEKEAVRNIPNFDHNVFFDSTGIDANK